MPVKKNQIGGIKLHKTICELLAANESMTTKEIHLSVGRTRTHIVRAMRHLADSGYFEALSSGEFKQMIWTRTSKPFVYEQKGKTVTVQCRKKKPPANKVEITIKPDLAAMWLVSSRPHWEKKSIPIRRSSGLGVRQSTF